MEFCPNCEKKAVVFGKTSLKVGDKDFPLEAEYCKNCGMVQLSSKNQDTIDQWGNSLATNIAEFQPYFSEAVLSISKEQADHYGLKWAEFVKVCTTFYLSEMTKEKSFSTVRKEILDEGEKYSSGPKTKKAVPVRYRLFKQLQLFSEIWDIRESNVIEEAILFCVTLLQDEASDYKQKQIGLQQFVEKYSMAS